MTVAEAQHHLENYLLVLPAGRVAYKFGQRPSGAAPRRAGATGLHHRVMAVRGGRRDGGGEAPAAAVQRDGGIVGRHGGIRASGKPP